MISTKEIEAKVISCSACNYTSYIQSELCRNMGHNVSRLVVKKRFFECKKCKNRTTSLGNKYPKKACEKCGESSWERTGMMKEKNGLILESEKLLIRGQEQSFVGASINVKQLNLDSID